MLPALSESGCDFAVIDFNPELHAALRDRDIRCVYGDISHFDTLEHAGIENAKVLISSIPDDFLRGTDNRRLLETLRRLNPAAKIIVIAESIREALALYDAGADHVLLPRVLTADHAMDVIEDALADRLADRRTVHIEDLKERLADEPE
jgi:Trk K+ transport system NAD-binding subunit